SSRDHDPPIAGWAFCPTHFAGTVDSFSLPTCMRNIKTVFHTVWTLLLTTAITSTPAQEISIPDPGLNAAIRGALLKPFGPLVQQDLLLLNELDACCRNITTLQGLEAAGNLIALD